MNKDLTITKKQLEEYVSTLLFVKSINYLTRNGQKLYYVDGELVK